MARRLLHLRYLLTPAYACTTVPSRAIRATMVRHYAQAAAAVVQNAPETKNAGLSKIFLKKHLPELLKPEMQAKFQPLLDKFTELGVEDTTVKLLVKEQPAMVRTYSGGQAFEENLKFLGDAGLIRSQISDTIKREPQLLMLSVPKVLNPKLNLLMERGLDGKAIVAILTKSPSTMVRDTQRELVPTLDFLGKFGIDKALVSTCVVQHPRLLSYDVATRLKPVVAALSTRLTGTMINKIAVLSPMVFARDVTMLHELMVALKYNGTVQKYGNSAAVFRAWTESMAWGVRYGVEAVRDKIDFLMTLDIPYAGASGLLRADPYIFKVPNTVLKEKLDFLLKVMKFDVEEAETRPEYLSTNCLERVKLRWDVLSLLKANGIVHKIHFSDLVSLRRKAFVETFVYKYPDCGRIYFEARSKLKRARAEAATDETPYRRSPF